jgi:hypothetical protein
VDHERRTTLTADRIKHLEFIQSSIARTAQNSFFLKGWAVTIVVALFALAAKDADPTYVLLPLLPLVVFWVLDGYHLSRERLFRALYDAAIAPAKKSRKPIAMFSMDTSAYGKFSVDNGRNTWPRAIFSRTLLVFYVPIVAAIVGFGVYFALGGRLFR